MNKKGIQPKIFAVYQIFVHSNVEIINFTRHNGKHMPDDPTRHCYHV